MPILLNKNILTNFPQREKCPNTQFFWSIFGLEKTPYLDTFTNQKKLRIWTFFRQCQYVDKLLDSVLL